ncbi:hypothetical protein K1719_026916 [Acacia pycnantha]|nr:hypothetical protein K1719_026916 [Acacia pycnantha]
MGLLSHRVERNEIKPGDHIYTYRAIFTYSHHGIFVGGSKAAKQWRSSLLSGLLPSKRIPILLEYDVSPSVFMAKIRGGTCTTAPSDPAETVIHRAMYLLQNGFGSYDVFQNNCEDFALYCKTGLLIVDKQGVGRSGQASSVIGAPLAAVLSSPLKLLMPSPVGVATVTAGMYVMSRYATDIGVRSDVIKVAVEDLAVNLGWTNSNNEEVCIVRRNEALVLMS